MEINYRKNGFVTDSVSAIVTMIVGVGIAVMVLIFVGILGGQTFELVETDIDNIGLTAVTGETFLAINGTAVNLTNANIISGSLSILNGSSAVGLGNFTVGYSAGQVTLLNNAFNNTNLTAAYNYGNTTIQTSIKNGIISSFQALEQTGDYLPIIVLAVVITLVMALVLSLGAFGGGNSPRTSAL